MLMPPKKAYASMVTKEKALEEGRYDASLNYHNLGKEKLLEALKEAENPIVAYVSDVDLETGEKREDRIVLVTEAKHNGDPIVIVNAVSGNRRYEGKK